MISDRKALCASTTLHTKEETFLFGQNEQMILVKMQSVKTSAIRIFYGFFCLQLVMLYEFLFVLVPFYSLPAHKTSYKVAFSNKFATAFVFSSFILRLLQRLLPLAFSNKRDLTSVWSPCETSAVKRSHNNGPTYVFWVEDKVDGRKEYLTCHPPIHPCHKIVIKSLF